MAGTSAQYWMVTATVGGRSWGVFDSHSGGGETADVTKYRPGGLAAMITFPALSEFDDLTVTRYWDSGRDGDLLRGVRGRVGSLDMTVTVQALANDGSPLAGAGNRKTYSGKLSGVTEPESDSTSGDAATFELTMVVEAVS